MTKIKRMWFLVWICACFHTIYAYAEPVQVCFDTQSADYNENLEVYLSNENSYYCFKLGPDNGYSLSMEVAEGDYAVHAFSIGDANLYYNYAIIPEKLTVKKGEHGQVTVHLKDNEDAVEDEGDNSLPPDITEPSLEPSVYDFTDGNTASGTLEVKCDYTSGVKSVIYLLVDETGKEYPVPLHADNMYSATVLLPYGTYHETGRPMITFFEDCEVSEDYRYTWLHTASNYFGNYYIFDETSPAVTAGDLAIVLHHNGDSYISPDFWELSITKKYYDNIVENITAIDQSVNADEYENVNRYLEKAGRETIPEASNTVEVTAEQEYIWPRPIMAVAMIIICMVLLLIFVFFRSIHKKSKY